MTDQLLYALHGGCVAIFAVIGIIFVRYYSLQRDRLLLLFALAFWLFALGFVIRIIFGIDEHRAYIFVPRLLGFLLIIFAIFDKNRRSR